MEKAIPLAVLLAFASEGNNAGDGIGLAKYANEWVKMVRMKPMKQAHSVKKTIFTLTWKNFVKLIYTLTFAAISDFTDF